MGIVAGLLYPKGQNVSLKVSLNRMFEVQKHRDTSNPTVLFGQSYAFGMANSHNNIFRITVNDSLNSAHPIRAFVDGIVLKTDYSMSNKSCSEIVTVAYEKWGLDFMAHLEGEFACAIWDDTKKLLILVRDPYGHKPLHYYFDNVKTVFSSEIKGVLAGGVQAELDLVSLSDFLSLNSIPAPATIFKNIKQVSPGQMVIISMEGIKLRQYWYPKLTEDKNLTFDETIVLLTDGIRQAVKKRLVKDDVFCFLSGGIDSSCVLSFASELSNKPVNAITVSFNEAESNELEDAMAMAKHVGAKHYHVTAKPDSFFDMLDMLVFHHDSPFTDTSAYPTYYAGKLAREFTDVILTGDGPDQTMGGSSHHVFAIKNNIFAPRSFFNRAFSGASAGLLSLAAFNPGTSFLFKLRRNLYRKSLFPVTAAYDLMSYFPDLVKKHLSSKVLWRTHIQNNPFRHPEAWFKDAGDISDINKYLFADIKFYAPDDLMIKVDRMSMASGLETVSPFQDIRLAQSVNRLPGSFKVSTTVEGKIITKYILRKVCENRFPEIVLKKRKQGFDIPLGKWLRQEDGRYLKDILLDSKTLNRGYFNKRSIVSFVNNFINCKGDYYYPSSNGIVALLTLELWHRRYLDRNVFKGSYC